jgi:sugar lactone lactonase YvrE
LDTIGNLYILDQVDSRIRKISLTGDVSTYTGTDMPGFLNGSLSIAKFQVNAGGIAGDEHGNIYIGDTFNERIRKISIAGEVITLAGNGTEGFTDGEAESAEFRFPNGVAVDRQDNLYIVDAGNFCIRKITKNGVVLRFAGSGIRGDADGIDRVAQFDLIDDIVVDNEGNLYVTDDNRIRKITAQGTVSTIAGSTAGYADGDGVTAKFKSPGGLGIDKQGNIYVADINNNRIRKISFE